MSQIKQEDFIQSVADALQYISYYHPVDYIRNLSAAYANTDGEVVSDNTAANIGKPLDNVPRHSASLWARPIISSCSARKISVRLLMAGAQATES